MANYATLKAAIQAVIKENGNREITGNLLQQTLLSMITSLGVGYQFMGVAIPSTNPGTPDQNVVYFAGPGTYPNFGGAVIPQYYIGVLYGSGSSWNVSTIRVSEIITKNKIAEDIAISGYCSDDNGQSYILVGGNLIFKSTVSNWRVCYYKITPGTKYYLNIPKGVATWAANYGFSNSLPSYNLQLNDFNAPSDTSEDKNFEFIAGQYDYLYVCYDKSYGDPILYMYGLRIDHDDINDNAVGTNNIINDSITLDKLSEFIRDCINSIDECVREYELDTINAEPIQSTTGVSGFYGWGEVLCENKTVYKVSFLVGNYTAGSISKLRCIFRKDTRIGDIINSKIIDFSHNDTLLHEVTFDFSDEPIVYTGKIYVTIQADATIKLRNISPSDYNWPPEGSDTTSVSYTIDSNIESNSGFSQSFLTTYVFYVKYVYDKGRRIEVDTENIFDGAVTPEKLSFPLPKSNEEGVRVVLPQEFVVCGRSNLQIFYRSIITAYNPDLYNVEVSVYKRGTTKTAGYAYPRYYEFNNWNSTIESSAGVYDMTVNVRRNDDSIIATGTSTIRVVNVPSSGGKNILLLGDSVFSYGYIGGELQRRLTTADGDSFFDTLNPKGINLSNINFIGRLTGAKVNVKQEAVGGWSWGMYASAGEARYRFTITSGGDVIQLDGTFTIGNYTFTVKEKQITSGSGNIACSFTGSGTLPTSGSFTFNGSTVTYSDVVLESSNPLYNENNHTIDFGNYSTLYCNGNRIDLLVAELGVNDMAHKNWSLTTILENIKTIARAYYSYMTSNNFSGKFIIATPPLPDPTGGMGANYGADGIVSNYYMIARRFYEYSDAIRELCASTEFSTYVFHCPAMQECDAENIFLKTTKKINNRDPQTMKMGNNAYHPSNAASVEPGIGDLMIADAIYQHICNFLL